MANYPYCQADYTPDTDQLANEIGAAEAEIKELERQVLLAGVSYIGGCLQAELDAAKASLAMMKQQIEETQRKFISQQPEEM